MSSVVLSRLASAAVCALVFAVGCHRDAGSTMQVKTNSAVVGSAARYRTYSHETADRAPAGYVETELTPDVLQRVRERIDVEMAKKGYVLVPSGDLVVRISTGVRLVDKEPTGRTAIEGAPVQRERVGSLVIDIFERRSEGQLFHGYAKDELHTKEATDRQISEAVTTILEPLPARHSGQ